MKREENIAFAFETMKMKLEHFYDAANALDQKISILIGFLGTILTALVGFFQNRLSFGVYPFHINPFSAGVLTLFLGLFLNILALTVQEYSYPPHEDVLFSEKSLNLSNADLKNQITADLKEGFIQNVKIQKHRAKLFDSALWLGFVGIFLILVDFLML